VIQRKQQVELQVVRLTVSWSKEHVGTDELLRPKKTNKCEQASEDWSDNVKK
jgi:hypothetical protein